MMYQNSPDAITKDKATEIAAEIFTEENSRKTTERGGIDRSLKHCNSPYHKPTTGTPEV
jgi:hypothetical protein